MARRATATSPASADALSQALARADAATVEVQSLRSVARRILAAQDLEAALSSVTHEALATLDADIAGVFLRDGDSIVMRGCAGNRNRETARLRMHRRQGLAGLVFATGEATRVDDYLSSEVISEDFHDLARAEGVQSALGAPLTLDGQVTGVLEVWRRRRSVFGAAETGRLVALADLGAIALHNAQLHEAKAASTRQVELAHQEVETQLHRVEHALRTQHELVASILAGGGLAGTLRIAGRHAVADVFYLDPHLGPVASYPLDADMAAVAGAARVVLDLRRDPPSASSWTIVDARSLVLRPVTVAGELFGWLGLLADVPTGDEALELALTQAALACSLNHLEEQAGARARAAAAEELLLNLLHGSVEERRVAASRLRHLHLDLRGELRVLVCALEGLAEVTVSEGWNPAQLDAARRKAVAICRAGLDTGDGVLLVAPRGDSVVALIRAGLPDRLGPALAELAADLARGVPGLRPAWGVSAAHSGPMELADACAEAETATRALRHVPGRRVSLYEELGILRLMLAEPGSADLARFVAETVGPVMDYDREHRTALMTTLRAYFDSGCSQQDCAARLFVHAKTVKYRLTQIESLTGLDLASHHDRLRVDIAVRAAELFELHRST